MSNLTGDRAATLPPTATATDPGAAPDPGIAKDPGVGLGPPLTTIHMSGPSVRLPIFVALAALAGAGLLGVSVGPANLPLSTVLNALASHLPFLHHHFHVSRVDSDIVWEIRLPRVVLGGLVGMMLAGGGAAYQGVFRNPLADPYLLGIAAGAGLGATAVIVAGQQSSALLPAAAFVGAVGAVTITYAVGATVGGRRTSTSIVLAGVAVAALLTAVQTYLQQRHTPSLATVYSWILGSLTTASWSHVTLILPYVALSAIVLVSHRRLLDVLRIGEDEADTVGVSSSRVRLTVVVAATLGTAAAVAVSGLIGFVGIIVPHTVRLTTSASYRVIVPVSMIGGAAFLILADVAARTVEAPAEIPIGVVTAFVGAPFFLFVLRSRRTQRGM